MGQISQTFSSETIKKMENSYKNTLEKPPQGAVFRARTANAVITAYNSGKVLFQGSNPDAEVSRWGTPKKSPTNKSNTYSKTTTTFRPPDSLFTNNHIGSDESGTGDYFGPVTTCAVYVTAEQINVLKDMGIQDSKAITDKNIHILAKKLIELNISYSLLVLHNERYNQLQKQGWTQGKMKAMLHYHVINNLLQKIGPAPYDGILVDQFCQPEIYIRHINSEQLQLPEKSYFMTKAESYSIAVAAGSVIARASFLNEMDKLSNEVGLTLLKGASQKVDQLIAKIMKQNGEASLHSIAKIHFANTNKAKVYL